MLSPDKFDPRRPVPTVARFVRIRDQIVINGDLKKKLEAADAPFIVTLIARVIVHEQNLTLKIPGGIVTIIASIYDANGGGIDVSGTAGSDGAAGNTGARGLATHTINVPGGAGGHGRPGGPGENGGAIRILAERLSGVELRANGGSGGAGGAGGEGGRGGDGHKEIPIHHVPELAGSLGGPGGDGANGGAAGKGGEISVEFTAAGVPPPLLMEVAAGAAGAAGHSGTGGVSGFNSEGQGRGPKGKAGRPGAVAAAGKTTIDVINAAKFYSNTPKLVGRDVTARWADYRISVGIYRYRVYKPNDALRREELKFASTEFDAALKLVPGHAEAVRYQTQIELGHNVLGLPDQLDVLPDFPYYFNLYAGLTPFVTNFFQVGIALLLKGDDKNAASQRLKIDIAQLHQQIAFNVTMRDAADAGLSAANLELNAATARLADLDRQIKAALAKKPDSSISIGDIVTTAAAVGAAVASVAAAVPTAGASLYALVPAIAGLSVQLSDMGKHLFEVTKAERDDLKQKYESVGKNVDNVVKGVKTTISFVQTMEKLIKGETPANAEVVGLMRQGVSLAHEALLAKLHVSQSELTRTAYLEAVRGGSVLVELAENLSMAIENGEMVYLAAGRSAVRAAQRAIDSVLTVAFKAQRSAEIYTFRDESNFVSFDSGFIHPDIEADFDDASEVERQKKIPELISAYSLSWQQLLDPIAMESDFDGYFTSDGNFEFVTDGVFYKSINDTGTLNAFKDRTSQQSRVSFGIHLSELKLKQSTEFEIKVQDIHVALVGATSADPGLGCIVRHGGLYSQRRRDDSSINQPLTPHVSRALPQFRSFEASGPPPASGFKGKQGIQSQNLLDRGVGGDWQISVAESDMLARGVSLSGLSEIQVWISTNSFVRK
jgi:hypothetical protein